MSELPEEITNKYPDVLQQTDDCVAISVNKYPDNTINECPICLEPIIESDAMIILECCKKTVHINCLCDWYSSHQDNKNCFMCNQANNFCRDLVYREDTHSDEQFDISHSPEISGNRMLRDNRRHNCMVASSMFITFCITLGVIISVVLLI